MAFLESLREEASTNQLDCLFALSLVTVKQGNIEEALDLMQRCKEVYHKKLGEFARKTKEVEETIQTISKQMA